MDITIGILVTGEPPQELQPRFPGYDAMLEELLRGEERRLGFTAYDVREGVLPAEIDAHDAYLITGSRHAAYEGLAWIAELEAFVRELERRRKPLIGICFGHQLIAQALGGRVEKAPQGWGVGIHEASVERLAPWLPPAAERFALVASHQDQVTALPAQAERLAGSDFCPNAMYRVGNHVFAMQSHPEFSREYSRALMDARRQLIDAERIERGMASLERETDAAEVARWMLAFLRQAVAARA